MTQMPWKVWNRLHASSVTTEDDHVVADCSAIEGVEISRANAAFIVKAVNNHDQLVETLQSARRRFSALNGQVDFVVWNGNYPTVNEIDAALAAVE